MRLQYGFADDAERDVRKPDFGNVVDGFGSTESLVGDVDGISHAVLGERREGERVITGEI